MIANPGTQPVLSVVATKAGTYTIMLDRGTGPQRYRAGIPTRDEARRRARVVADLAGYRLKRGT